MAVIECPLEKGITIGNKTHRVAVLTEHNAGMTIEAGAESERVVMVNGQPHLVSSPNMVGIHVLRRQIVSIGDLKGPLELEQLALLSNEDLNRLYEYADRLELAAAAAIQAEGRLGDLSQKQREDAKILAINTITDFINSAVKASRSVAQAGRHDGEVKEPQTP